MERTCPNCKQEDYVVSSDRFGDIGECDFCGRRDISDWEDDDVEILEPGLGPEAIKAKLDAEKEESKREEERIEQRWLQGETRCQRCKQPFKNSALIFASPHSKPGCSCYDCSRKYGRDEVTKRRSTPRQHLLFCKPCYEVLPYICKKCSLRYPSYNRLQEHLYLMSHYN